ncbi:hypothetical protein RI129_004423 [Pyrocoelia pectoralis]|uniref:chitinase n=1 Tax=Pyrocoelia pectoralis TaxID=417401 RepID=A0AAN7VKZ2_9COLE
MVANLLHMARSKLVCYYSSWSVYRSGNGAFNVEDIDPHLCTHLIYAFIGIDATGSIRILDSWNDIDKGAFRRFNELKSKNRNLKTLIAVGGWREGSEAYSRMAGDRALRLNFINSAIKFMTTHGFDGFDIDWEYPAQRGGVPADKANFATLVREFRTAIGTRFLLSIATGATGNHIATSYDVPSLAINVDFINVMTYDLHGSWSGVTGANAPLYSTTGVSVSQCIDAWIANGTNPSKIVMGIPVYGRTFTLANPAVNGMGAPAPQPGNPGPFTQEAGIIGYNEMCVDLQTNPWTVVWDNARKVPYMEFLRQRGLGGAMGWSIETDDFRGVRGRVAIGIQT